MTPDPRATAPEAYLFAGNRLSILVPGEATGDAYSVILSRSAPGSQTPPHLHEHDAEVVAMLEGELRVQSGGRSEDVGGHALRLLPPRQAHRLVNASGAAASYFVICAPAGFERFVRAAGARAETDALPRAMTVEERQRLVALAPEYGIRLLGPDSLEGEPAPTPEPPSFAPRRLGGVDIAVAVELGCGADALRILQIRLPGGAAITLPAHAPPEALLGVAGEIEFDDGRDGVRQLTPGNAALVEPGAAFTLRNTGDAPARLVTVTTRGRADLLSDKSDGRSAL